MPPFLTPGLLTYHQRQLIADVLIRVGVVPQGFLASLYTDADLAAARALNRRKPVQSDCRIVGAELATAHGVERVVIGFAFGFALGLRLGRSFAPPPKPRSKWISDDYQRLTEHNRRDVARYIRKLRKAQDPPKPKAPSAEVELAAAKRWAKEAGKLVRKQARGDDE